MEDQVDPDRDGDGFSNTDELASGSDPFDPNSMPNRAPSSLSLSADTISENQPVGSLVGQFSAIDPDGSDSFIYTLVEGTSAFNVVDLDGDGDLDLIFEDALGAFLLT